MTLRHSYRWACDENILTTNPEAVLPKIKARGDKDKFKTIAEISAVVAPDRTGS